MKFVGTTPKVHLLLFLFAFLLSCTQSGQQNPTQFTVGIINPNYGVEDMHLGFIEGLARNGYVEGKNIKYIQALGPVDLDKTLENMIAADVDLIFSVTTPTTKKTFAMVKDRGIPVVFALYDPVAGGVINSLSDPGKNITGIRIRGSVGKALDWLLQVFPDMKNILVPIHYDSPATKLSLEDLQQAASLKGINVVVREIKEVGDISKVFKEAGPQVDGVFMIHSIFISSNTEKIVAEAMKYNLPVGGGTSSYTKGAMITYGVFADNVGLQASRQANLILKGKPAGEIPAEISEFFMGINLNTAQRSGITIPNDILVQADDIIPYKK